MTTNSFFFLCSYHVVFELKNEKFVGNLVNFHISNLGISGM